MARRVDVTDGIITRQPTLRPKQLPSCDRIAEVFVYAVDTNAVTLTCPESVFDRVVSSLAAVQMAAQENPGAIKITQNGLDIVETALRGKLASAVIKFFLIAQWSDITTGNELGIKHDHITLGPNKTSLVQIVGTK